MSDFPVVFDRDVGFINWTDKIAGWSTSSVQVAAADWLMRSTGVTNIDHASVSAHSIQLNTTVSRVVGMGVHISGPLDTGGDELTAYSYNVTAMTEDPNLIPVMFWAVSPAAPSAAAGGDTCLGVRVLAWPDSLNAKGNTLNSGGVIALPVTDPFAAGRAVAFGIGMLAGAAAPLATTFCHGRLSVRRLVRNKPTVYDQRKV